MMSTQTSEFNESSVFALVRFTSKPSSLFKHIKHLHKAVAAHTPLVFIERKLFNEIRFHVLHSPA